MRWKSIEDLFNERKDALKRFKDLQEKAKVMTDYRKTVVFLEKFYDKEFTDFSEKLQEIIDGDSDTDDSVQQVKDIMKEFTEKYDNSIDKKVKSTFTYRHSRNDE